MIIKDLKKILINNERGVALLMVIGFVTILSALLVDFSFETKINTLKAYNSQDRVIARLNAEAGLNFAMGQLRIYQEARNLIEKNENAKSVIKPSVLEATLTQPFMFPIPAPSKASALQRSALEDFTEETLIIGQFRLQITPVRGFLNPNFLRMPTVEQDPNQQSTQSSNDPNDQKQSKKPHEYTEEKILELIQNQIESFKEDDDPFIKDYPNIDPKLMVAELKVYVNNPRLVNDPLKQEALSLYARENIVPKHAPLTSISEMHYLLGWPEYLLKKVMKQLTVHEVGFISLNDLDINGLKLIFPQITPEQIEEFFRHRDGDAELNEKPQPFRSAAEFKSLIVEKLSVVSAQVFDDRAKEFEQGNLKFGVAGKLYKVESTGIYDGTKVVITAFVDLPVKDPPKKPVTPPVAPQTPATPTPAPVDPNNPAPDPTKKEELKLELLSPRIIEIIVD
jgi:hypothetical protein